MQAISKGLSSLFPWTSAPLIVGAPMRVFGGPELALSVSAAGGLGFIGPSAKTQDIRADLEAARDLLPKFEKLTPYYDQQSKQTSALPIGVGFQLWTDDIATASELVQQYRPSIAWLFAPRDEEKDFAAWSSRIRAGFPDVQIWIQIGTMNEVKRLLQLPSPPDAIVVQGAEAGGHGRAKDGIGLATLVPEVVEYLQEQKCNIPVLAAGGIANGRGVAAALCLGASGAVMGTRFLAATESRLSRGYQQEIVRASDGATNTTRTHLYNHLRGTFGWPEQFAPRTIINRSYVDQQNGVSFDRLKELHDEASKQGDKGWGPEGRLATYAGASIGLVKNVKPAGEIVSEVQRDAQSIIDSLATSHKS